MRNVNQTLLPVDIYVLLGLIAAPAEHRRTQAGLAHYLHLSGPTVSRSLRRLEEAALWNRGDGSVPRLAVAGLLEHGVRYFIPARIGALSRGVPTAHSSPPLASVLASEHALVWPEESGTTTGTAVSPLHDAAPRAAVEHPELHELLALVDSLRVGRARERKLAMEAIRERLDHAP